MTRLDSEVQDILDQMNAGMPGPEDFDVAAFRAAAAAQPAPPVNATLHTIEDQEIRGPGGPLPCRIYRPAPDPDQPAMIYLHGGGFILHGLDNEDAYCRRLAAGTGATVYAIDYRPAPEHPFPAAIEDTIAALTYIHDHASELGIDPNRITLAGMSAGATIAAGTALRCRDRGGPRIHLQVLVVPQLQHRADTPSRRAFGQGTHGITTAFVDWASDQYAPGPEAEHPHAAPLRASDLGGLPPAYIHTATLDPLHDDGVAYATRLAAAGVPVEHHDAAGLFHGFHFFADALPTAADQVATEITTLRRLMARSPGARR